ncbi:MAG: putative DNA binding domain-containing protein [Firmicutes bacterium]|nr:putative DNA binding domain-containing protein [Bacillota bacterium]
MALPINIQDLIHGRKVENERIEYKKGFNPLDVMQTMCAFANDINNWGGGYIILGIEAISGVPQFPAVGIEKADQDGIYQKMLELSFLTEPHYSPMLATETIGDKDIIVIWAFGGDNRPYKCPVVYGKNSDKAYYIRKGSSTVKAAGIDERRLFEVSVKTPYDDRPNQNADIETDLDIELIKGYLRTVKSDLLKQPLSLKEIADRMLITGGYKENPKPLNVGLMFFNSNPERFFRCARIEVVDKPSPNGQGMTEKIFTGPLDRQLRDALQYIKNYILKEKVFKVENQAEALRIWNYPYSCIEEILVNAAYHKGYDVSEPIVVTITPDKMQIKNCPGPDLSISDAQIKDYNMVADRYRNRRIGDFLKELEFVEGRNTGIPTALESLKDNGSEPMTFETNADRTYFTVTIPVHKSFLPKGRETQKRRSRDELKRVILVTLSGGEKSAADLATALGYTKVSGTMAELLKEMIAGGQITYLYPDKANHPKQKFILIAKSDD